MMGVPAPTKRYSLAQPPMAHHQLQAQLLLAHRAHHHAPHVWHARSYESGIGAYFNGTQLQNLHHDNEDPAYESRQRLRANRKLDRNNMGHNQVINSRPHKIDTGKLRLLHQPRQTTHKQPLTHTALTDKLITIR